MEWISENKEWFLSGLGVVIVGGVFGFISNRKKEKSSTGRLKQKMKSGKGSTNVQGGNDVTVTIGERK